MAEKNIDFCQFRTGVIYMFVGAAIFNVFSSCADTQMKWVSGDSSGASSAGSTGSTEKEIKSCEKVYNGVGDGFEVDAWVPVSEGAKKLTITHENLSLSTPPPSNIIPYTFTLSGDSLIPIPHPAEIDMQASPEEGSTVSCNSFVLTQITNQQGENFPNFVEGAIESVAFADKLFFTPTNLNKKHLLFATSGTSTSLATGILPPDVSEGSHVESNDPYFYNPKNLTIFKNTLYFTALYSAASSLSQLYRIEDGKAVHILLDLDDTHHVESLLSTEDYLYAIVRTQSNTLMALYRFDGGNVTLLLDFKDKFEITAETQMINISNNQQNSLFLSISGGTNYLFAIKNSVVNLFFKSDGGFGAIVLTAGAGSDNSIYFSSMGVLYRANGDYIIQLIHDDHKMTVFQPILNLDKKLYFTSNLDNHKKLFLLLDSGMVKQLTNLNIDGSDSISLPTAFQDQLYFSSSVAGQKNLYRTNGQEMHILLDTSQGINYDVDNLFIFQDNLYFTANDKNSDQNLYKVSKSDVVTKVLDLPEKGLSRVMSLTQMNGSLYFTAVALKDGQRFLYRYGSAQH